MSISCINSNNCYQSCQTAGQGSFMQQVRQDFNDLAQALGSGDLSGAQAAFSAFQQLLPASASSTSNQTQSSTTASSTSNPGSGTVMTDLSNLGQALQAGNLSDAQNDFSKLTQDLQSIGGHHHHHMYSNIQNTGTASASGSTGNSTNPIVTDLSALGQALQSGNLTSAQSDYSQLQQDFQAVSQNTGTSSLSGAGSYVNQLFQMWMSAMTPVNGKINLTA